MPRSRKPPSPCRYFKSSPEVIRLVVLMYVRFPLSLRNVEDLLFERGIDICHETVRMWWNRFGPMTDMMADGIGNYAEMKGRLQAALAARAEMDGRLEDEEVLPEPALHPGLAEAYRRSVEKLVAALNAPELEVGEALLALRNLVELITAEPRAEGRGVDLVVHGRLAQVLRIANNNPDLREGGPKAAD